MGENDEDFLARAQKVLPKGSRISDAGRSEQTQESYYKKGWTKARGPNAPHVRIVDGHTGAIDVAGFGGSSDDLRDLMNANGFNVTRVIDERVSGGSGPHQHLEFGTGDSVTRAGSRFVPTGNLPDPITGALPAKPEAITDIGATATSSNQMNPDKALPVIAERVADVDRVGAKAADTIDQADSQLQQVGKDREAALKTKVALTDAMLDDQGAQTRELQNRVTPIFAARAENAQRMVEVARMNPFKRSLLSIFNPKYDMDHLKEVDDAYSNQAREVGQEYDMTHTLSTALMGVVEAKYRGHDEMAQLRAVDLTQDIAIANQGWNVAQQRMQDAIAGVTAGENITRAQVVAREGVLSQMTPGQINTGIAQAKRQGGSTVIGGVTISQQQLQNQSDAFVAQAQAKESREIALKSGKMDLARQAEAQMIAHMTPTQRAQAIKDGGKYNGMQLDVGLLTQGYNADVNGMTTQAQVATNSMDAQTYTGMIDGMNAQTRDSVGRLSSVLGTNMPPQFTQYTNGLVNTAAQWDKKIRAAPEAARPLMRQQAMADIASQHAQFGKVADSIAQGMTRDPDAQIVLGSWFKGIPLTGDQAVRGVIALTRDRTPMGALRLQGTAAAAFKAAQAVVKRDYEAWNAPISAIDAANGRRKLSKVEFESKLRQDVSEVMGNTYAHGSADSFYQTIPQIAKAAGDPAGQIDPRDYGAAIQSGDAKGIAHIAQDLGWSPEQAQSVFGVGGSKEDGFNKLTGGKTAMSYAQASQRVIAYQDSAMLRDLDASHSARPGFQPSRALVNFMHSDKYKQGLNTWGNNVGNVSFGDMVGSAVSGHGVVDVMGIQGTKLITQYDANQADDTATARSQAQNYNGSPVKRMRVIIGSIPGMSEHDAQLLSGGVLKYMNDAKQAYDGSSIEGDKAEDSDWGSKADFVIMHGKFEDPHLESLRKLAAKNWKTHAEASDSIVGNLAKMIGWQ